MVPVVKSLHVAAIADGVAAKIQRYGLIVFAMQDGVLLNWIKS